MDNKVKEIDQERIQKAVREILEAIGEDPEREGLRDTPSRIGRMMVLPKFLLLTIKERIVSVCSK